MTDRVPDKQEKRGDDRAARQDSHRQDPKQQPGRGDPANEGEGNRTAARHYNDAQHKFAESGKVASGAKDAEKAIEGPEGEELRRAEEIGKKHSHGEDPLLNKKGDASRKA
jgi:hypothetical protein